MALFISVVNHNHDEMISENDTQKKPRKPHEHHRPVRLSRTLLR